MDSVEAVTLIRHPRARRLRLRFDVRSGALTLTLPPRVSVQQAKAFIAANQGWIMQQQARRAACVPFTPTTVLELLGQPVCLGDLVRDHDPALFAARAERAIRRQALAQFAQWAAGFSQQLGLPAPAITLRDTKSRWGSCTARGRLNLSWRLALAPLAVARYVVAHEVAHRRQMNHSPAFWSLVTSLVGNFAAEERWLAQEGHKLLQLGVSPKPQAA